LEDLVKDQKRIVFSLKNNREYLDEEPIIPQGIQGRHTKEDLELIQAVCIKTATILGYYFPD
jgi:hypothetical protein